MGKVYFNARFDDVMLIVKREMASVLRGPLSVPIWGCNMFISSVLLNRNDCTGISLPGKSRSWLLTFVGCAKRVCFALHGHVC